MGQFVYRPPQVREPDDSFEKLVRSMFSVALSTGCSNMNGEAGDTGVCFYNRAADLLGEPRPLPPAETAEDVLRDYVLRSPEIVPSVRNPMLHTEVLRRAQAALAGRSL